MNENYFNRERSSNSNLKDSFPNNNNSFIGYQTNNPNPNIYQDPKDLANITLRKIKPPKLINFNDENYNIENLDTTNISNTPPKFAYTPEKKSRKDYEATLNSKLKKTQRRDCTPFSPNKTHKNNNDTYYNTIFNNENISHINNNVSCFNNETSFSFGQTINDSNRIFSRESLQNISTITNISNNNQTNQSLFNEGLNFDFRNKENNYNLTFTQQKSKFLKDLENGEKERLTLALFQNETEEEKDVKYYLKGSLILEKLEYENQLNINKIYQNLFDEKEIHQKITLDVVRSFFDGYNNRSKNFYKYIVS